jgi:hypothetical protein
MANHYPPIEDAQLELARARIAEANARLGKQLGKLEDPYAELKRIFDQAFTGQTEGKAKARHNKTGILPFEQQRIMTISEMQNSPYGLTYQVTKKMLEALDMDEVEKTIHELQGVMVYVGALILFVERRELRRKPAAFVPGPDGKPPSGFQWADEEPRKRDTDI